MTRINEHGQPIGDALPDWRPPEVPRPVTLEGRYVRLEPLAARHAAPLVESLGGSDHADLWTYRPDDAPESAAQLVRALADGARKADRVTFAVVPTTEGVARAMTSLMRIDPAAGSVEIGSVIYARALQRTPATTETTYLLARYAFDLGYRRLEWKLDALNEPSAAAARRLGFTYEGRHRNALVYKGRSRDTDWFSIVDSEWPAVRAALEAWLDPANFDGSGRQRRSLAELRSR